MKYTCMWWLCYSSTLTPPQLIARITKDGWFSGEKKGFVFRDILDQVGKFLRVSLALLHLTTPLTPPPAARGQWTTVWWGCRSCTSWCWR